MDEDISEQMKGGGAARNTRSTQRTLRRLYVAHVLQCLSTTMREQAAPGMVY